MNIINKGNLKDPIFKIKGKDIQIDQALIGVVGCLLSCKIHTLNYHQKFFNVNINNIEFNNVEAEVNLAGFMLKENEISMLNYIKADVKIDRNGSQKDFDNLIEKVEKCCPVYNMLNTAGVKLELNFKSN